MKPQILIVEDNLEILDFIAEDLGTDYQVLTAMNGEQALGILEKELVQLVVSDVMMPVMDGFELCRQIKFRFQLSHIPVILLTAKNTLQSRIEGLDLGADAYIEKPFSPEHLQVQVANLIRNRNQIKTYFSKSLLLHIKSISHSKEDDQFLESLNEAILLNLENPDLDVEHLAKSMNMSLPTLYRKIKAISDLTPNELISITRLKKAAELLATGKYKIYEVSDMVGYNSQNIFGRNFLKQFGITPTDYLNMKHA